MLTHRFRGEEGTVGVPDRGSTDMTLTVIHTMNSSAWILTCWSGLFVHEVMQQRNGLLRKSQYSLLFDIGTNRSLLETCSDEGRRLAGGDWSGFVRSREGRTARFHRGLWIVMVLNATVDRETQVIYILVV